MKRSLPFLLVSALASGCLPIPWPRTTTLRPDLTVAAVDQATDAGIANARVRIVRYNLGPPPELITHRWTETTGSDGRAHFEAKTEREWVLPLMMHGVPQWCFSLCLDAPGYAPRSTGPDSKLAFDECGEAPRRSPLVVALARGTGTCDWRNANGMPIAAAEAPAETDGAPSVVADGGTR